MEGGAGFSSLHGWGSAVCDMLLQWCGVLGCTRVEMERGQEWRARNEVGGCGMKLCCCWAHVSNITMVPEGI